MSGDCIETPALVPEEAAGSSRQASVQGWAISAALHGLALGAAFLGWSDPVPPVVPDTFTWEVSLHEAAHVEADTIQAARAEPPVQFGHHDGHATTEHARHTHHVVAEADRQVVTRAVEETVAHPVRERPPTGPAPIMEPKTVAAVQQPVPVQQREQAATEVDPIEKRTDIARTESVEGKHAPPAEVATPDDTVEQGHDLTAANRPGFAAFQSNEATDGADSSSPTSSARPAISASVQNGSGPAKGPDYGWLKRLLWERIDRVKQYSEQARENEWQGRVVLLVTIDAAGRIDEIAVERSSGHAALDRDAGLLVQAVSPLSLTRTLGSARVRLRVPLRFGLEP